LVGLRRLKERGHFEIPESIREATTEFEDSNDVTAAFLDAECVREQRSRLSGQQLYNAYKIWCEENGHRPLSSTRIPQEWKRLDIERKRISGVSYYEGVRLKMPSEKRDDF
jgi:putative DNA primase/helicase